jgi:hypothetical protein
MKKVKHVEIDTRVIVFTTLFCKRLNMSLIEADKDHTLWVQLSYYEWLETDNNDTLKGYDNINASMNKFIDGCFV